MDYDPMMKLSIKVTRIVTEALQSLQEMFYVLKRQKQQLPIMILFQKVEKNCPLSKTLSHQHHLRLTSSCNNCFRLISLLHLPKKMVLMTLLQVSSDGQ